ncbi:uroporphyrinogen-III decarboxylase [Desulfosporosinus orientis DSM 765]|uniref:Uroporphyrinogen-III decarboxylase n=1 Tax=Desulfosporosinus orientis (strain ATCC 19365 / DSM 765 / NCIMB 8382 / VKM B-1628 / Singapore I) TaxID=768706 RepID=G7WGN7_DESOD|nr:uroporphyrinogen decarboxylase family protein [Desulfosporosinus orientis]AET68473.1 uroporphyrinogen-III decarboxylase [Desulfosporosinus orientis DSM 765]
MDSQVLLAERKARIAKAVALEETDRTPVILEMAAFTARVEKIPMAKWGSDSFISAQAMINTFKKVGGADGVDYGSLFPPLLSLIWLSKVKLAGKELPEDSLWQVSEAELMTKDDYDRIITEGYPNWMISFFHEKIGADVFQQIMAEMQKGPEIMEMWKNKGIPVMSGGTASVPFEYYCGARSFAKFVRDLYKIPDKVQAAMDAALPYMTPQTIQGTKELGCDYMWIGGWRSAGSMLSQPLWDRFVFPYFEKVITETIEAGLIPILHFDSDWTRDLERFKIFPKGKCILELDGMTDIFKAKEILGDTMCIMGDVPASMFTLGTPDEVYKYSRKLIEEIGPQGFILHSGCDIPIDAKLENVQAMVAAATGK